MVVSKLKQPSAGSLRQLLQDKEREFAELAQQSFQTLEKQVRLALELHEFITVDILAVCTGVLAMDDR